MNADRVPKQGEVWRFFRNDRTIVAVDGEVVVVRDDQGELFDTWVDGFTDTYDPPAPTKVSGLPVRVVNGYPSTEYAKVPPVGHLTLWSDGTVTYEVLS